MKYSFVALALAAVVSAQSISDIPTCAQPCLEDAIKKDTTCEVTDLACVCKSFDKIQGDATACVLEKCGSDVAINQVLPAASKLCANPPSGGASSAAAASSAPASSAPAETQPASSSAAAASSSVPPAEMPSVSTPAPAPETTTKVVVPPASSAPVATPVPTAAAASLGSMGGLAMLVLGAMAL